MNRRHFNATAATLLTSGWTFTSLAQAPAWPDKPVKLILSKPPGSGPDNVARLVSDRLAKTWGQAVVIDNKAGGQNVIGAQAAARAPADGTNFYFATTAGPDHQPAAVQDPELRPAEGFRSSGLCCTQPVCRAGGGRFAHQIDRGPGGTREGRTGQAEPG